MGDNPFTKARELSPLTGRQTVIYNYYMPLGLLTQNSISIQHPFLHNPIALIKTNFGLSECNRVEEPLVHYARSQEVYKDSVTAKSM